MSYCGESTVVKSTEGHREAVSLRCRSWICPDCEPQRKRQLIAQAHRGKPNTFVTLTCRRSSQPDPDAAALALSQAWRLVHKRALREANRDWNRRPEPAGPEPIDGWHRDELGRVKHQVTLENGKLPYLVVIEAHVSGWPHLHILCRSKWISQKWLSLQMDQLLQSPIVHISRVTKQGQVAGYVVKYCGKCAHKFGTAKRYWESQSYQLSKYEKKQMPLGEEYGTWTEKTTIKRIASYWSRMRWEVVWQNAYSITATLPP